MPAHTCGSGLPADGHVCLWPVTPLHPSALRPLDPTLSALLPNLALLEGAPWAAEGDLPGPSGLT